MVDPEPEVDVGVDVDDPDPASLASPCPPTDPLESSVTFGATVTLAGGVVTVVVTC